MRIGEIFQKKDFGLSIEIFPPKTPKGDSALIETLERLSVYRPDFVSCTYGAGGSTRERTLEICVEIQNRFQLTATSHYTCVGSTRDELCEWLSKAQQAGITNIMALRGDPPEGEESFQTVEDGFSHANELVTLIREEFPKFGIGVAGYPEKHSEAPDMQTDMTNLKRKVDAGADAVFTQLFYVNDSFFKFRDRCEKMGITVPIVPGIMPITEFARIQRITSMCGTIFPDRLASQLEKVQEDKAAQFEIGVEFAIAQCQELLDNNVAGIHFYALNRSPACERILNALGIGTKDTPHV
jgi:methylenetetrahydrofolate reductase (NADPH)